MSGTLSFPQRSCRLFEFRDGAESADFRRERRDFGQEEFEDVVGRDDANEFVSSNDGQVMDVAFAKDGHHVVGSSEFIDGNCGGAHDVSSGHGFVVGAEERFHEIRFRDKPNESFVFIDDGNATNVGMNQNAGDGSEGQVLPNDRRVVGHDISRVSLHNRTYDGPESSIRPEISPKIGKRTPGRTCCELCDKQGACELCLGGN